MDRRRWAMEWSAGFDKASIMMYGSYGFGRRDGRGFPRDVVLFGHDYDKIHDQPHEVFTSANQHPYLQMPSTRDAVRMMPTLPSDPWQSRLQPVSE